jgi:hypothetical protein
MRHIPRTGEYFTVRNVTVEDILRVILVNKVTVGLIVMAHGIVGPMRSEMLVVTNMIILVLLLQVVQPVISITLLLEVVLVHLVGGIGQLVQRTVTGRVLLEHLLLIRFTVVRLLVAGARVTHTVVADVGIGIMVTLDGRVMVARRE